MLEDPLTGKQLSMNQIGDTSPCDSWQLPNSTYFKYLKIGYDTQGVQYLQAITNNKIEFSRGVLKASDSSSTQSFSLENPLVGLQGYETSTVIKALGVVKYNCSGF